MDSFIPDLCFLTSRPKSKEEPPGEMWHQGDQLRGPGVTDVSPGALRGEMHVRTLRKHRVLFVRKKLEALSFTLPSIKVSR